MKYALILSSLMLFRGAAQAQEVVEVEARVTGAWSQVVSLTATLEMESVMVVNDENLVVEGDGLLQYRRFDTGERFHQSMTANMPPPLGIKAEFKTIFDGEFVYNTRRFQDQVSKSKEEPNLANGALPPGGSWLFATLHKAVDLKRLPDEIIDDVSVYVLEGTAKEGVETGFKRIRVYIDKDIGLQRQLELFDGDDILLVSMRYVDVKLGAPVDDTIFEVNG